MGTKKIQQDLRDAGVRKKRARNVAKAADRARAGDRAARELVELQSAALRDSVSAVVRYAKPPTTRSSKTASAKTTSAKRTATKRSARRSTAKSATPKAPAQLAGTRRTA